MGSLQESSNDPSHSKVAISRVLLNRVSVKRHYDKIRALAAQGDEKALATIQKWNEASTASQKKRRQQDPEGIRKRDREYMREYRRRKKAEQQT